MIIRSKAPLRLGLAGGGSDVSPYSELYGGLILNATINLYAYTTIEERADGCLSIDAQDVAYVRSFALDEELVPAEGAALVKGVILRLERQFGWRRRSCRITTWNDAPVGSGLGTSSAMVVSILKAFVEWLSLPLGDYDLARLAYEIERKDLGLSGGKQDQYAAAFGGFNFMEFQADDRVIVNPLKIKRWIVDELEASLLLYFTGASRSSARIIDQQVENTTRGHHEAIAAMHRIKESAVRMKEALLFGDMEAFARLIAAGWEDKKKMADGVSNPQIQAAFDVACAAGAISGKVSGAGGGGFIIFVVDPTRRSAVERALRAQGGRVLPFQFSEGGAHGWKIVKSNI